MSRLAATGLLTALLLPAAAQSPPAAKPAASSRIGPDTRPGGLTGFLSASFDGQPVIAVDANPDDQSPISVVTRRGDSLKSRLQATAEAASREGAAPLIPFALRGAWVIAPETRKELDLTLTGRDPLDFVARSLLLNRALAYLSPDVLAIVGVRDGISLSRLPADARQCLMHALRPPLVIRRVEVRARDDRGSDISTQTLATMDQPLDWRAVRLRARLDHQGFIQGSGWQARHFSFGFMRSRDTVEFANDDSTWNEAGVNPAPLVDVPNRLKPSDLDGARFPTPLGFHGVSTVGEIVRRAARVTGLRLLAHEPYASVKAFVGSDRLSCGDVLDGIRFALGTSWRRLGDRFLLVQDRAGLAGQELLALDYRQKCARLIPKDPSGGMMDARWYTLLQRTPCTEDDRLALTATQRALLYPDPPADPEAAFDTERRDPPVLPFAKMTPEQQDAIRGYVTRYGSESGLGDTDIPTLGIDGSADLIFEVSVPGLGWVRVPNWGMGRLFGDAIYRSAMRQVWQTNAEYMAAHASEREVEPFPMGLERAVVVPPLSATRLRILADQLHRAGVTTLFYPALYDGCATFPSPAFPLHPTAEGRDNLADAMAAMAAKGVRVLAYMNTLAWREPNARLHWLDRYPELLDRDALGASRRQWSLQHDSLTWNPFSDGVPFLGDYVRPDDPAVSTRLNKLLDGLAARASLPGLAFARWEPSAWSNDEESFSPPPLGYAAPERAANFEADGVDPLDMPLPAQWARHTALESALGIPPVAGVPQEQHPGAALVKSLLQRAATKRPDWTTVVLDDRGGARSLMQDRGLREAPYGLRPTLIANECMSVDPKVGMVYTIWPSDPLRRPRWMREQLDDQEIAIRFHQRHWGGCDPHARSMTILDFRLAPDAIPETLAALERPRATTTAGRAATPAWPKLPTAQQNGNTPNAVTGPGTSTNAARP